MDMYRDEVLSSLPPGLPERIGLKAYSSDRVAVLTPGMIFSEPKEFDCFKFLIHVQSHPKYVISKKSVVLQKHHLYPINPAQAHAGAISAAVPKYYAIFMNKAFLQDLASEMHGSRDIFFSNDNYRLSPAVLGLLEVFIQESVSRQAGYQFILQGITIQLAINILRECRHNLYKAQTDSHKTSDKAIEQAIEFLHANYNKDFSLEEISQTVSYSSFHFLRLFKQHTGQTPFQYLQDLKLDKARHLLKETSEPITDICFSSGFNNNSHFSTAFKRKYGVSPLLYRNSCK